MHIRRYLQLISFVLMLPVMGLMATTCVAAETNGSALPLTAESAAELAKSETGGRVLSVQEEMFEDKAIFRIKVLHDSGTVRTYRIERDTGQRF